jgi:sarcosine oxidase gamma subunit
LLIHQVDDEPAYVLYGLRSFAEYLWLWLEHAAEEYGMTVMGG